MSFEDGNKYQYLLTKNLPHTRHLTCHFLYTTNLWGAHCPHITGKKTETSRSNLPKFTHMWRSRIHHSNSSRMPKFMAYYIMMQKFCNTLLIKREGWQLRPYLWGAQHLEWQASMTIKQEEWVHEPPRSVSTQTHNSTKVLPLHSQWNSFHEGCGKVKHPLACMRAHMCMAVCIHPCLYFNSINMLNLYVYYVKWNQKKES